MAGPFPWPWGHTHRQAELSLATGKQQTVWPSYRCGQRQEPLPVI